MRFIKYRNSETGKEYRKTWRQNNIEKVRLQAILDSSRRRARRAGNGVFYITPKDMRHLTAQNCFVCVNIGEHVDHIIPISRGGRHSIGNLQMLCKSCNLSKQNKLPIEWRVYRDTIHKKGGKYAI